MGFDNIGGIAHKMEDRLKEVRDGSGKMTDDLADFLFASLDKIGAILEAGGKGEAEVEEKKEPVKEQAAPPPKKEETARKPTRPAASTPAPKKPLVEAFAGTPAPKPAAANPAAAPPPMPAPGPRAPAVAGPPAAPPTRVRPAASPPAAAQETIRVDTQKVDELVNVSGEMVVNHIRFEDRLSVLKRLWLDYKEHQRLWLHIRDHLASSIVGAGEMNAETSGFYDMLHRFSRHMIKFTDTFSWYVREVGDDTVHLALTTTDLQREVMALRMVPVAMAFDLFRRTIRDIAREAGKDVRVEIRGRETEIDKKMIEGIKDPLVHLVRNAIDHGIETPEERVRAGKPREGAVELCAREEGDRIIIEVKDDGRGIDPNRVKEAALRKGIISREEAAEITDAEAIDLIFRPSFSTIDRVTETSGRGVGMDVVKSSVEALKGEVHIATEVGRGTTFSLTLPLTLAVTRVLFVEVSGKTFGLPTPSVLQTAKISRTEVKSIERREAIQVRNRTIPLVALGDMLSLPRVSSSKDEKVSVVILQSAGEQIAFVVDTVIGEQEIVLKNLGVHLQRVPNVAGAALLGSGDVVLVLHVPDLFASSRLAPRQRRVPEVPGALMPEEQAKRVLIVEDSLTTRELERNILAAHGYEVDVANDGIEGLHKLSDGGFDLVVADISMPRMDGLQMIARIKEDERTRNVPVILVTASDRPDDRRRGMELGIEGYVVKSAFDQTGLLDTIQSLIG
jgi:two-component system chemotaxis sensor kinase CheA